MKKLFSLFLISFALTLFFIPVLNAEEEEEDDIHIFGLEVEKLLNLGSGILALFLFIITVIAYFRTDNIKLIFISIAFFLFSIKGFLQSHELFIEELTFIDPLASFLNFLILISFFIGVMKK